MSAEDQLRDILRAEAARIVPAGDGLARIQARVARKRRARLFLVPGAALAAAGVTLAFVALGGGGTQKLTQTPATPGPAPTATTEGTPAPQASSSPAVVAPAFVPALWPFSTQAQVEAWRDDPSKMPWAGSSLEVARHFVSDYLRLTDAHVVQNCVSCDVVAIVNNNDGKTAGQINLVREDGGTRAFSVASVDAVGMAVTSPKARAPISSPTTVKGTLEQAVDESVRLQLVTAAGAEIAMTSAPAGSAVPWQGSLSWSDQTWTMAAIVARTGSFKDGTVTRLAVLAVTRGPASGPTFAGLQSGHVSLFDPSTGKQVRQLTYPPSGRADTGLSWNGSTLVWVRSQQTGCADELNRMESGATTTLVPKGTAHLGTPRLSPDGRTVAYLSTPCDGSAASVVVLPPGAPSYSHPTPAVSQVADVQDDGTALVTVGTKAYVVPATTSAVTDGDALASSCRLQAPAFDGTSPVAWESCQGDEQHLVRFSADGARASSGPLQRFASASSSSVRGGTVLVSLNRSGSPVEVRLYENGTFTKTLVDDGSVREPSW